MIYLKGKRNQRLRSILVLAIAKNREDDGGGESTTPFNVLFSASPTVELITAVDLNAGTSLDGRFNGRE